MALIGCTSNHPAATTTTSPTSKVVESSKEWPPTGLEFLKPIPELRGVDLSITEEQFKSMMHGRKVQIVHSTTADGDQYWVFAPSGENAIVMFDHDGKCRGIQRMPPSSDDE